MMKKFLLLLTLPFLMMGCNGGDDPEPPVVIPSAPITIFAYLVADNNLDDDLMSNIGAMYDGMTSMNKQATLLVYWDAIHSLGNIPSTINSLIIIPPTLIKSNTAKTY